MITLKGTGAVSGIAFGTISFLRRSQSPVKKTHISDVASEISRFKEAKNLTLKKLEELHSIASEEVGESGAMIFEIHSMMLEDQDYCANVHNIIESQKINAEYAIVKTSEYFSKMFESMEGEYLQSRAADVGDISQCLLETLSGKSTYTESIGGSIFAADYFMPSEVLKLAKSNTKAFITRFGSINSHAAILAKAMGIPTVIDLGNDLKSEYDLMEVIVDGVNCKIYIDPDQDTKQAMTEKKQEFDYKQAIYTEMLGKKNVSRDKKRIDLYASIGSLDDIELVKNNDAEGIGIFRSEYLYLQSNYYPSEDEQFHAYRAVVHKMEGKPVIIRTLDIGCEKQADYFDLPQEENPALGYRSIRISLTKPQIFKTQLRALYRASAYGEIAVMFPMIISVEEVRTIKETAKEVMADLKANNIKFDRNMELGIIIETPAAVIMSDELAKEVDFFSIGTTDLIKYTLAVDNQNQMLDNFYNPYHPAVLRQIKRVVDNAHKNNIWVEVCGELASDPKLLKVFLSIEVDCLAVSPSLILPLRKKVRDTNVSEIKEKCMSKFMPKPDDKHKKIIYTA